MKTPEQVRIENKLKLWEYPGFFQFINDLQKQCDVPLNGHVTVLLRRYTRQLEELEPKSNFKQGKLDL